jgi:LysR family positive regulator for ilvC
MTPDQLQAFIALAERLHFGQASRDCHLSRSALTRVIQRMEEEAGQKLFYRDRREVSLTAAGRKFQRYAREAIQNWKGLQEELSNQSEVSGSLSLYSSVTAVYSLLPELLERFREQYPAVQFALRTGAAEEAVPQVMTGEIDLAVAALPDRRPGRLEFLPLRKTALVFIGPKGLEGVPFENRSLDLEKATLVLPSSGLSRRRVDALLKKRGARPEITTEVSGNEAIIAMVRLGCGVGVVPELVLERSPFRDDVEVIKKAPKLTPYEVGLCTTKKNLSRSAVAALWALAG